MRGKSKIRTKMVPTDRKFSAGRTRTNRFYSRIRHGEVGGRKWGKMVWRKGKGRTETRSGKNNKKLKIAEQKSHRPVQAGVSWRKSSGRGKESRRFMGGKVDGVTG